MKLQVRFRRIPEKICAGLQPFRAVCGRLPVRRAHSSPDIVDIGRCANDGVNQAGLGIHADVGLHAKVPLVALLGLMHLRVALAGAVLGRTGRGDQGGVHRRAGLEHQPFLGKGGVDRGQQLDAQVVLFEQMPKPQDGGLIGQARGAWVKASEFAIHTDVMQRLFHGRVTQAKPLLQKVDAQHGLYGKRRAPALVSRTRRKGCNQRHQLCPRNHPIHLVEKHALASALGHKLKSGGGEADLFHVSITFLNPQALAGFCRNSLGGYV